MSTSKTCTNSLLVYSLPHLPNFDGPKVIRVHRTEACVPSLRTRERVVVQPFLSGSDPGPMGLTERLRSETTGSVVVGSVGGVRLQGPLSTVSRSASVFVGARGS